MALFPSETSESELTHHLMNGGEEHVLLAQGMLEKVQDDTIHYSHPEGEEELPAIQCIGQFVILPTCPEAASRPED